MRAPVASGHPHFDPRMRGQVGGIVPAGHLDDGDSPGVGRHVLQDAGDRGSGRLVPAQQVSFSHLRGHEVHAPGLTVPLPIRSQQHRPGTELGPVDPARGRPQRIVHHHVHIHLGPGPGCATGVRDVVTHRARRVGANRAPVLLGQPHQAAVPVLAIGQLLVARCRRRQHQLDPLVPPRIGVMDQLVPDEGEAPHGGRDIADRRHRDVEEAERGSRRGGGSCRAHLDISFARVCNN